MSDRMWACLTIGGPLPLARPDFVKDLIAHIRDYTVAAYALRGRLIQIEDSEASYGKFEDLEDWLSEVGVCFDRESAGYGEYSPEKICFRAPDKWYDYTLDNNGMEVVITDNIRKVLGEYECKKILSAATLVEQIKRVLPDQSPALEPIDERSYRDLLAAFDVDDVDERIAHET